MRNRKKKIKHVPAEACELCGAKDGHGLAIMEIDGEVKWLCAACIKAHKD